MTKRLVTILAALLFLTSQVLANNWLINSYRFAVAVPASITFLQCAISASDLTTYTFATQNTGTASANRHTVVAISAVDGATIFRASTP